MAMIPATSVNPLKQINPDLFGQSSGPKKFGKLVQGLIDQKKAQNEGFNVDSRLLNDPMFGYNDPEGAEAALIESQRADFEQTFRPNEEKALDLVNRDYENEAEAAGRRAGQSITLTRGEFNRSLERSGQTLTAENKVATDRASQLSKMTSIASGENLTRRAFKEMNTDAKGDLISIGKGIAGASASNMTAAANNSRAVAASNRAEKAQSKANLISTGIGVAALAMMI